MNEATAFALVAIGPPLVALLGALLVPLFRGRMRFGPADQKLEQESAKLTATVANNLATVFIIGAVVTPAVSGGSVSGPRPLVLAATGVILHVVAQLVLRVMWVKEKTDEL